MRALLLISLTLVYSFNQASPVPGKTQSPRVEEPRQGRARMLSPGELVDVEINGGQVDSYQVQMRAGQCGRVVVNARQAVILIKVIGPTGEQLIEALAPAPSEEPRRLSVIAKIDGLYSVEASPFKENSPAVRYGIKLEELRPAVAEDEDRVKAERLVAEGQLMASQGRVESLSKAIENYDASLKLWQNLGDRHAEASALGFLGSTSHNLSRPAQALDYYKQALAIWRSLGDRAHEAQILNGMGWTNYSMGEFQMALDYYNQALPIRREVKDYRGQAQTITAIGQIYGAIGEPQKAIDCYNQSLPLARQAGDRVQEAFALSSQAFLYVSFDEDQKALDCLNAAFPLWIATGNRYGEADALNTMGMIFDKLGAFDKSLDYYSRALGIWRYLGNRAGEADALSNMGVVYWSLSHSENSTEPSKKAIDFLSQALAIRRSIGQRSKEAVELNNLGLVYDGLGDEAKALDCFNQVIAMNPGDASVRAAALHNAGLDYYQREDYGHALDYCRQALGIFRRVGDKNGEARALRVIALAEENSDKLDEALSDGKAALDIIESVRSRVASVEMRASYHVITRDYYDLLISVLGRLARLHPARGYDLAALEISEKARARGLLDLLTEGRIDITRDVEPALLQRERALQQQLNAKEQYRMKLLAGRGREAERAAVEREIASLSDDYEDARSRIRAGNARYAALTQPGILTANQIQHELLDQDTVLLEYCLADAGESTVWAITTESATMTRLSDRAELESATRRLYDSLVARNQHLAGETPDGRFQRIKKADAEYQHAAAAITNMLLAPVAGQLGKRRLVFVTEGALQYIPFAALPAPDPKRQQTAGRRSASSYRESTTSGRPLILDHEIVNLPSASVLSVLRKETASRAAAAHSVAILADPVFNQDDPRVRPVPNAVSRTGTGPDQPGRVDSQLADSINEPQISNFGRLRFSKEEADGIAALGRGPDTLMATGFAANRDLVLAGRLDGYRILHFATHGFLNNRHPELSGVVLSLVDETGKPRDGFLRLNEIYKLKFNADLVVLSACETALGKEIQGEGLIGLTRGFMYAGVPRIVASLWKVDDWATAELMKRFYRSMLVDQLPPAAAIRAAQISLLKEKGWEAPYFWAAFTLEGDWK
jgi:CHAT domain-containing protein